MAVANELKAHLSLIGQLPKMLASLQKQLNNKQANAAHECERADVTREEVKLVRDVLNRIQNQFLTQLEVL